MSKSKGNVVDPNDVVDEYGADVLRVYILFMGEYGSAAPWNDSSMRGCKRFLDRVAGLYDMAKGQGSTPKLEVAFNKTIKKVTEDIEEMKFNTAIASMMALTNEIYDEGSLTVDELKSFIGILCPFAPHLCEELWEMLGEKSLLSVSPWPAYDEAKTVDSVVEIGVQVNGKFRGTVCVPADATKEQIAEIVKADEKIAALIEGKNVVKEIIVPGKIANIIVK